MLIFPAIRPLRGPGRPALQGQLRRDDRVQRPTPSPSRATSRLKGAAQMHTVDLEGARDGGTPNLGHDRAHRRRDGPLRRVRAAECATWRA